MEHTANNKRIAKNTVILFFRLLITLSISLYVSRLVLDALGVEDYGIYSVVASFVTMFGFINSALTSTTQRFISFEMEKKNSNLRNVFSMTVFVHVILGFLVLILSNFVGVWFINEKLTIPVETIESALVVFYLSILTAFFSMISIPFFSAIVSYEKMKTVAYISVAESVLKLLGAIYLSQNINYDSLILYAVILLIITISIKGYTIFYCLVKLDNIKINLFWDSKLCRTLLSFSGWSLWGGGAFVIMNHGVNLLLNMFFGPVVNASKAIATQLQGAVLQFSISLQMAMNPQIVKNYATGDLNQMKLIVLFGAKYLYFLLLLLCLPIIIEVEYILNLWLINYPIETAFFVRLMLVGVLIDCLSSTLMVAIQASGRIALYQTIVGGLLILNLPISYFFLSLGFEPQITVAIYIVISMIALYIRLLFVKNLMSLNITEYFNKVLMKTSLVSLTSCLLPLYIFSNNSSDINRFLLVTIISILGTITMIYFLGLDKNEKKFLVSQSLKIRNQFKGIN